VTATVKGRNGFWAGDVAPRGSGRGLKATAPMPRPLSGNRPYDPSCHSQRSLSYSRPPQESTPERSPTAEYFAPLRCLHSLERGVTCVARRSVRMQRAQRPRRTPQPCGVRLCVQAPMPSRRPLVQVVSFVSRIECQGPVLASLRSGTGWARACRGSPAFGRPSPCVVLGLSARACPVARRSSLLEGWVGAGFVSDFPPKCRDRR
jgi:hypothetical protein